MLFLSAWADYLYLSVSSSPPISPPNCEEPTLLRTSLAAENSACGPVELNDRADSIGLLSTSNGDLPWPSQEFLLESQLNFTQFPSNMLGIPRRKSCRLPIKDPADGSTKIFFHQSAATANRPSLNHEPVPCFTIPGAKKSRVIIKDPLDGSIKLPENEVKCVNKRPMNTETCKASPLFARPSGTKVVVKDPLNMSILDFASRT
ncbi:hypothetical protein BJX64DRAFT_121293 [Aspergillus heterothallicus]